MIWAKQLTIVKKTIKRIFKYRWEIANFNLSTKILKTVNDHWTQLLLVQKHQKLKQQERTLQKVKEKHENSAYQKTQIQK